MEQITGSGGARGGAAGFDRLVVTRRELLRPLCAASEDHVEVRQESDGAGDYVGLNKRHLLDL